MKTRNRGNALLVELMIAVLVFMLAGTILMRVFAGAHAMGERAERIALSLAEAQSHADRLYAAEDPEQALAEMGYTPDRNEWIYTGEGVTFTASLAAEESGLIRQTLTVRDGRGETLLTLPCSRWREVSP